MSRMAAPGDKITENLRDNFIDVGEPDTTITERVGTGVDNLGVDGLDEQDAANQPVAGSVSALANPPANTPPAAKPGRTIQPFTDLPYTFAKRHGVLLEPDTERGLLLVHKAGITMMALTEARRKAKQAVTSEEVSSDDFDARLTRHYEGETGQAVDIMDDFGEDLNLEQLADALPEPEDLLESTDDAPVIRLINAMLTEAVRKQASDIHIEPFEKRLAIRYRVDGVMQKLLEPPRAIAPLVISRLKVMAKLDIAERRLPQDGRISLRIAGRPVDVRVSTLPSGHGERVVLRLLDKQAGRLDLEHLGMPQGAFKNLTSSLSLSHGIILVTGPTGSGKTTTLYASLSRLNTSKYSILTVEDPIEYYIDGIGQTQVNNKVELDFARGLRAILRQDPDIVMVGEIRDVETAEIAVQASLTGHLVLSTLHTNTAVGSVTRLRDMGIEPFLLSSSLVAMVAQRLVRVLCVSCKRPATPTLPELETLGVPAEQATGVCVPHGCDACNHTGFSGRTGVYEVVNIDDTMRSMIHDGESEHRIEAYARTLTPGILDDGIRLVLEGRSSLEEVLYAVREN